MDQQEDAKKAEERKRDEEKKSEERKAEERKWEEEKKSEERKAEEKRREEKREKREPYVFEEERQVRQVRQSRPAKPAPAKQDRGGPRQGDDELQQALSMDHPGLSDAQKSVLVHQGYKSNPDFDKREAERKASAKTDHAKPATRQVYEFSNEKDQGRPDMQR